MQISKWNEIEDVFTKAFGWSEGIDYLVSASRNIIKARSVYELSDVEDNVLTKKLRETYNKEMKCLEKEKAKWKK